MSVGEISEQVEGKSSGEFEVAISLESQQENKHVFLDSFAEKFVGFPRFLLLQEGSVLYEPDSVHEMVASMDATGNDYPSSEFVIARRFINYGG